MKENYEILTDLLSDDSFVHWLHNEASTEEQQRWDRWLEQEPDRKKLVRKARSLYSLPFDQVDDQDTGHQLHRLKKTLDTQTDSSQHSAFPSSREVRSARRPNWFRYAMAASILLVVGVLAVYFQQSHTINGKEAAYITMSTDYAERDTLSLSDGSQIVLNANTRLRYQPRQKASADVRVELQGEALFLVEHRTDRVFSVVTPDGVIEDLGTKFNVNTRGVTQLALLEGRVQIFQDADRVDRNARGFEVKPGEFVRFSKAWSSIQVDSSISSFHISWIDDQLVLDDTPFRDVVKKLEDTYGVKITVTDEQLLERRVSGSIRNPDLDKVLEGLKQTMRLHIERKEQMIIVSAAGN